MIELANYNKVVAQRNKLLKEISFSGRMADTLEIWDEQMVRYGTSIISERKKFISRLNDILSEIHQNLTGGKEQILITYEPNVSEEGFSEELKAGRERDLRFGQSYTERTGTISVCGSTTLISVNTVPRGSRGRRRFR